MAQYCIWYWILVLGLMAPSRHATLGTPRTAPTELATPLTLDPDYEVCYGL